MPRTGQWLLREHIRWSGVGKADVLSGLYIIFSENRGIFKKFFFFIKEPNLTVDHSNGFLNNAHT